MNVLLVCLLLTVVPSISCQRCLDPSPDNGYAKPYGKFNKRYFAIINCNTGYTISGVQLILCRSGNTWSAYPTCKINDCGDPTPTFGTSSGFTTTYQSTTTIGCTTGYTLSGTADITCQADGTWSATPKCNPTDCSSVTIVNGVATPTSGTYLGNTVTIACNSGYTLNGSVSLVCQDSGYDYVFPTCDVQDCGNPAPTNGSADTPKGTTFGEVAMIYCDSGYTLVGSAFIACQAGPTWNESPTCTIIDCGNPAPTNGSADTPTGTAYGEMAVINCDTGYTLNGSANITCQAGSVWSESPTCDIQDCGNPTAPTNGSADTPTGTTYGEVAIIICDTGYTLNGSANITCQAGSVWSESPTCDIQDCGNPTAPTNGSADTPTGTTYGEVAIIICDTGYTLNGSANITCQAGSVWSEFSTCDIQGCNFITSMPNTTDCTKYIQCVNGSTVAQSCPGGLLFNPGLSVCDWPENVDCEN